MIYTAEEYKILAYRFNQQSFLGKLVIIKNNPTLFLIESDCYNLRLRLEEEAMNFSLDELFEFPQFLEFSHLKDIFSLIDVNIKKLK